MATTTASPSTPLGPSACEADAKALQLLEEMTTNADRVQEKVLAEILGRNAQTEYLARFKLGGATDRATFKSLIPVIVYEDIQPEIQRIVDGDRSAILTVDPITELITSSGTSAGKNKLIPSTRVEMDRRRVIFSFIRAVINSYVPELDKGKGLHFMFVRSETETPGGLTAHPLLTSFYKSERFRNRPSDPYSVHTSPIAAILCTDAFQSMYTQMLCGFLHRIEILHIGAPFASGLLRIIHFLQLHWEELVADIAAGSLGHKITDLSIRESMAHEMLKPDPELASSIATECSTGEWAGIIKRIWPNTKFLDVIVTGAMAQYIPTLEYYSGGLPMVSKMYASSECFFGINLRPMCKPSDISYTIMPNMAYFEFLPYDPSATTAAMSRLVDLTDVEVGKEYEVVVTTSAGLYRYRVGDIVWVSGFHNATPQFRFVRRKNVVLSIEVDKTDEVDLQGAVERAAQLLKPYKVSVVEYSSRVDTETIPGHYVIYWELLVWEEGRWPDAEVLERCCLEMEEALNSEYRQGRAVGKTIGPLEIRVVRKGTFDEVMDYAVSRGASIGQYKLPRCVNLTPIIDILESRVVSTHFSQGCPKWTSWTSSISS